MAAAAVQSVSTSSGFGSVQGVQFQPLLDQKNVRQNIPKHDVDTVLNFHKDNEDGSPPAPQYAGKSASFNERPTAEREVTIRDVAGQEDKYTLDKTGFQFHRHTSVEKDLRMMNISRRITTQRRSSFSRTCECPFDLFSLLLLSSCINFYF